MRAITLLLLLVFQTVSLACIEGHLRLTEGVYRKPVTPYEGLLQICRNGEWHTFCGDDFTSQHGEIACQQLFPDQNFPDQNITYLFALQNSMYQGHEDLGVLKIGVCVNNTSLMECDMEDTSYDCGHTKDVGLDCRSCYNDISGINVDICLDSLTPVQNSTSAACTTEGHLRLTEGVMASPISRYEGLLEICRNGKWHTFCDDDFVERYAEIACQQLFPDHNITHTTRFLESLFRGNSDLGTLEIECSDDATSLAECSMSDARVSCGHLEDIGLRCYVDNGCTHLDSRLSEGEEGWVEMCRDGTWQGVSSVKWGANEAAIMCKKIKRPLLRLTEVKNRSGSPSLVEFYNMDCDNEDKDLKECQFKVAKRYPQKFFISDWDNVDREIAAYVQCLQDSTSTSPTLVQDSTFFIPTPTLAQDSTFFIPTPTPTFAQDSTFFIPTPTLAQDSTLPMNCTINIIYDAVSAAHTLPDSERILETCILLCFILVTYM